MTTQSFFIPGILPNLNDMINEARRSKYPSARQKKQHTQRIAWLAKASGILTVKRAGFHFTWLERNKRRDPDNIRVASKYILDGLIEAGILSNDGWNQIEFLRDTFEVTKGEPGVNVIIIESEEDK